VPYLSTLEVCSRRGAIQIHVYLTLYLVMLRFWFFHLDSISIRFFTKNSMSIQFQFFHQEISYTSPINLGTAMLNYSSEAGEAGDDSEICRYDITGSLTVAH